MNRRSIGAALGMALVSAPLVAQEEPAYTLEALTDDANVLWTCLAAFLVFFMQAGFACVEAGLTRAKNACNIIMKNVMDLSVGSLLFWAIGFGLMFGASSGWIGKSAFFFDPSASAGEGQTIAEAAGQSVSFSWAFLLFQTVFCATAATIVSGAMAGRTRFRSYLLYTAAISVIVYPIFGSWAWGSLFLGEGWLEGFSLFGLDLVFHDFAGSTVVHSIGGWAALAGALVIGPRLGKYRNGKPMPIPGHNIPLAALGVFILWLGWFGFNPGSTTAVQGGSFALIAVNTNIAAAAGAVAAMTLSWLLFKKPDTSFTLNGALAGLVAITAGCDVMTPLTSAITGLVGGSLVVGAVLFFERLRVDDPVGAISVHGVCGAWGTLAVGLYAPGLGVLAGGGVASLVAQVVGIGAAFLWAFPVSLGVFAAIHATVGLRVSAEEELIGLDIAEHGMEAYPGFAMEAGRDAYSPGMISRDVIPEAVRAAREAVGAAT